jgi:hypothetical protein
MNWRARMPAANVARQSRFPSLQRPHNSSQSIPVEGSSSGQSLKISWRYLAGFEVRQENGDDVEKGVGGATEQEAIAALVKLGAKIERDDEGNVISINLGNTRISDAGLVHLKGLTSLERLNFMSRSITDEGLVHLKGLKSLVYLGLTYAQVTDEGLVHLKELKNLESLRLRGTKITDSGLVHLQGLQNLKSLSLPDQITEAGLQHLQGHTNLKLVSLPDQITDAGLAYLQGMTNLEGLNLAGKEEVTDAGLQHLKGVTNLQSLQQREAKEQTDPFLIYFGFSHPHDKRDGKPELLKKYGAVKWMPRRGRKWASSKGGGDHR